MEEKITDLGPTEDQLTIETKCDWCWIQGLKAIDIEPVETNGGMAQRCVDRAACRLRSETALRMNPASRSRFR